MFRCIEAGKRDVNEFMYGETLLHSAADEGNVAAGKRLLQLGADASLRSHRGWTAMHYAVRENNVDFCAILPAFCLTQRTKHEGYTMLQVACLSTLNNGPNISAIVWLLEQMETELTEETFPCGTIFLYTSTEDKQTVRAAFAAALARRQRWTPPRAAWMAACCCTISYKCCGGIKLQCIVTAIKAALFTYFVAYLLHTTIYNVWPCF